MSLGLGIFLSTLVAIAAWQIDKRGAWRKAGKVMLWVLGVIVMIGAGGAGYLYFQNSSDDRAKKAIADELRAGRLMKYWGIDIGMSQEDVLYLKGNPSERAEKEGNAPEQWNYFDSNSPRRFTYTVFFDDAKKVDAIACASDDPYFEDCEKIAGAGVGDDESLVTSRLGEPTTQPIINEKGYKVMDYANVRLILNKQRVEVLIFDRRTTATAD